MNSAVPVRPPPFGASASASASSPLPEIHTLEEEETMRQSQMAEGKLVERLKMELKGLEGCMSGLFQPASRAGAAASSRGRAANARSASTEAGGPVGGLKVLSMTALSKVMKDVGLRFLNIIIILTEALNGGGGGSAATVLDHLPNGSGAGNQNCCPSASTRLAQTLLRREGSSSTAVVTLPYTLGGPHVAPKLIMYLLEHILTPLLQSFSTSIEDWSRSNHHHHHSHSHASSSHPSSSYFDHKASGELRSEVIGPFCEILELLHCYLPMEPRHSSVFSSTHGSAARATISTMTTGAGSSSFTGDAGSGGSGVLSSSCLSLLLPLATNRRNSHNGGGGGDLLRRTLMEEPIRNKGAGGKDDIDDVLKGIPHATATAFFPVASSSSGSSHNNNNNNSLFHSAYSVGGGSGSGSNAAATSSGGYYSSMVAAAVEGSAGSLYLSTYAALSTPPPPFSAAARKFPFFGSDADSGGVISHATSSAPLLWKEGMSLFFFLQHIQHVLESEVLLPVLGPSYIQMLMWLLRFESYARCVHGKLWIQPLVQRIITVLERVTFSSSSSSAAESGSSFSKPNKRARDAAGAPNSDMMDGDLDASAIGRGRLALPLHTPTEEEGVVYTHLLDVLIGLPQFMFAFSTSPSSYQAASDQGTNNASSVESIASPQERLLHRFAEFVLRRHQHKLTHNAHNLRFEAACLRSLRRLTLHLHAISAAIGGNHYPSHLFQNEVVSSVLDQLTHCLCNAADHPMTERAEAWRQEVCGWWSLYVSLRLSKPLSQLLPADLIRSGVFNMANNPPSASHAALAKSSTREDGEVPSARNQEHRKQCSDSRIPAAGVDFSSCSPKFIVSLFELIWPMLCRLFFLPVANAVQRRVHYSFVSYLELFRFPCPSSLQLLMDAGAIVWYSCTASFRCYLEFLAAEFASAELPLPPSSRLKEKRIPAHYAVDASADNVELEQDGERTEDHWLAQRLVSFQLPLDTYVFPLPPHRRAAVASIKAPIRRLWVSSPVSHLLFCLYKELYGEAFIRVVPSKRPDVIIASMETAEPGVSESSWHISTEEVHGVVAYAVPSPIQHWGLSTARSKMGHSGPREGGGMSAASTSLTVSTVAPVLYWLHLLSQPCTLLHSSVEECDGLVRALFPLWLREMKDVPALNIQAMVLSAVSPSAATGEPTGTTSPPPQAGASAAAVAHASVYNLTGSQHNAALVRLQPLLWAVWTTAARRCSADTRALLIRTCMTHLFPSQTVDRGVPPSSPATLTGSFPNPVPALVLCNAALQLPAMLKQLFSQMGTDPVGCEPNRRGPKLRSEPSLFFSDLLSCPSSVSLYFSLLHTLAAQQLAFCSSGAKGNRGQCEEEYHAMNEGVPAASMTNTCFFASRIAWLSRRQATVKVTRDDVAANAPNTAVIAPYHAVEAGGVYLVFLGQLLTYLRCGTMYRTFVLQLTQNEEASQNEEDLSHRMASESARPRYSDDVVRFSRQSPDSARPTTEDGFVSRASERAPPFGASPVDGSQSSQWKARRHETTRLLDDSGVQAMSEDVHTSAGNELRMTAAPATQPATRLPLATRISTMRDTHAEMEKECDESTSVDGALGGEEHPSSSAHQIEEFLSLTQLAAEGLSRLTVPLLVSMMEWLYRSSLLFWLPKVSCSLHPGDASGSHQRSGNEMEYLESNDISAAHVSDTAVCATVSPAIGILFCTTFLTHGPHVFSVSDDRRRLLAYHTSTMASGAGDVEGNEKKKKQQVSPLQDEHRDMQSTVEAIFSSHGGGSGNPHRTSPGERPPLHPDSEEMKREMSRGVCEEEGEEVMEYESMCFMQMLRSAESYVLAVASQCILTSTKEDEDEDEDEDEPSLAGEHGDTTPRDKRTNPNLIMRPSTEQKDTGYRSSRQEAACTAAQTVARHLLAQSESEALQLLTTLSPQNDVGDGRASSQHAPGSLHTPLEPVRPFFMLPSVLICSVLPQWTLFSSQQIKEHINAAEEEPAVDGGQRWTDKKSRLSIHVSEQGRRDDAIRQLLRSSTDCGFKTDIPPPGNTRPTADTDNREHDHRPARTRDQPDTYGGFFPPSALQWVVQSVATSFASLLLRQHDFTTNSNAKKEDASATTTEAGVPASRLTSLPRYASPPQECRTPAEPTTAPPPPLPQGADEAMWIEWTTSAICLLHWLLRLHRIGIWQRWHYRGNTEEQGGERKRSEELTAQILQQFLHESQIQSASPASSPSRSHVSEGFTSFRDRQAWMQRVSQCILTSANATAERQKADGWSSRRTGFLRTSVAMTIMFNCLVLLIRENISKVFCWTRLAQQSVRPALFPVGGGRRSEPPATLKAAVPFGSFSAGISSSTARSGRIPFDRQGSMACSLHLVQLLCLIRPLIRGVQRLFEDVGEVLSDPLFQVQPFRIALSLSTRPADAISCTAEEIYVRNVERASCVRQLVSDLLRVLTYTSLSAWGGVSQRMRSQRTLQQQLPGGEPFGCGSAGPLFVPCSPHQVLTRLRPSVCTSVLMALRSSWSCLATLLLHYFGGHRFTPESEEEGEDFNLHEYEVEEEAHQIRVSLEEAIEDFLCYHHFIERLEKRHVSPSSHPSWTEQEEQEQQEESVMPTTSDASTRRHGQSFLSNTLIERIKKFLEQFTLVASPLQAPPTGGASGQKVEVPPYSLLSPVVMDIFPLLNALQWVVEEKTPMMTSEHRKHPRHGNESATVRSAPGTHQFHRDGNAQEGEEEDNNDGWRVSGAEKRRTNTSVTRSSGSTVGRQTSGSASSDVAEHARRSDAPLASEPPRLTVVVSSPMHPRWLWLRLYLALVLRYGGKNQLPSAVSAEQRDRAQLPSSFFFYSSMGFDGLLSALHHAFLMPAKTLFIKKKKKKEEATYRARHLSTGEVPGTTDGMASFIPQEVLLLLREFAATFFPLASDMEGSASAAPYGGVSLGLPSKRLRHLLPATHVALLTAISWAYPWKPKYKLNRDTDAGLPHDGGRSEDPMFWIRCFGISLLPSIPLSVRVVTGRRFAGLLHALAESPFYRSCLPANRTRPQNCMTELPYEVPSALQILLEGAKEGLLPSHSNVASLEHVASTSFLALAEAVAAVGHIEDSILYTVLECWSSKTFVAHEGILQWLSLLACRQANPQLLSRTYTHGVASTYLLSNEGPTRRGKAQTGLRRTHQAFIRNTLLTPPVYLSRPPLRTFLFHWLWASEHRIEAFPHTLFGYPTLDHLILDGQVSFLLMMGLLLGAKASYVRHLSGSRTRAPLDFTSNTKSNVTVMGYRPSSLYDRVAKLYYSSFNGCRAAVRDHHSFTVGETAASTSATGRDGEGLSRHERKWVWSGTTDLTPAIDQLPQITALLVVLLEADGGLPAGDGTEEEMLSSQQRVVAEHGAFLSGVRYTLRQQEQWKSEVLLLFQWLDYAIRQVGKKVEMTPSRSHEATGLATSAGGSFALAAASGNVCLPALLHGNIGALLIEIIRVCSPSRTEYLSCASPPSTVVPKIASLQSQESLEAGPSRSLLVRSLSLACSMLFPYVDWQSQCRALEEEFEQKQMEKESKRRKAESAQKGNTSSRNGAASKKGKPLAQLVDDDDDDGDGDTQDESGGQLFSTSLLRTAPPPPALKLPVSTSPSTTGMSTYASDTSSVQDHRITQLLLFEDIHVEDGTRGKGESQPTESPTRASVCSSASLGSSLLLPYALLTNVLETMSLRQRSYTQLFDSAPSTGVLESVSTGMEMKMKTISSSMSSGIGSPLSRGEDMGDGREEDAWPTLLFDVFRWYTLCTELYAPDRLEKAMTLDSSVSHHSSQGVIQARRKSCLVLCRFIVHRTAELLSFWLQCASHNSLQVLSKLRRNTNTMTSNSSTTSAGNSKHADASVPATPVGAHVSTQGVAYLCRLLLLFTPYIVHAEWVEATTRSPFLLPSCGSSASGKVNNQSLRHHLSTVDSRHLLSALSKETLDLLCSLSLLLCPSSLSCMRNDYARHGTGPNSTTGAKPAEGITNSELSVSRLLSEKNHYHDHLPLSFQLLLSKTWNILCEGADDTNTIPVPLHLLHPSRIVFQLYHTMKSMPPPYGNEGGGTDGSHVRDPFFSSSFTPSSVDRDKTQVIDAINVDEEGTTAETVPVAGRSSAADTRNTASTHPAEDAAPEDEEDPDPSFLPLSTSLHLSAAEWSCLPADLRVIQQLEHAAEALQVALSATISTGEKRTEGSPSTTHSCLAETMVHEEIFQAEAEVLEQAAHHISCIRGRLINAIRLAMACSALGPEICAGIQQKGLHAWAIHYASAYEADKYQGRSGGGAEQWDPLLVELAMSVRAAREDSEDPSTNLHLSARGSVPVDDPRQKEALQTLKILLRLSLSYDALEVCRSALTAVFRLCEVICEYCPKNDDPTDDNRQDGSAKTRLSPAGIFWKDDRNITHHYSSDPFHWAARGNVCSQHVSTTLRGSRLSRFTAAALNTLRCVSWVFIDLGLEKEATLWLTQYEQRKLPFLIRATRNPSSRNWEEEEAEEKLRRVYLAGERAASITRLWRVPSAWSWVLPCHPVHQETNITQSHAIQTTSETDALSVNLTQWPFHTCLIAAHSVFLLPEDCPGSAFRFNTVSEEPQMEPRRPGEEHGEIVEDAEDSAGEDDEVEDEAGTLLSSQEEPQPFCQILSQRPWYAASLRNVALPKSILASTYVQRDRVKSRRTSKEDETISLLRKLKNRLKRRQSCSGPAVAHKTFSNGTSDVWAPSNAMKMNGVTYPALFYLSSFLAAYTVRAPYQLMMDIAISAALPSKTTNSSSENDASLKKSGAWRGSTFASEVSYPLLSSGLFTVETTSGSTAANNNNNAAGSLTTSPQLPPPITLEARQQKLYFRKFASSLHHPQHLHSQIDSESMIDQALLSGYRAVLDYWSSLAFASSLPTAAAHLPFPFDPCSSPRGSFSGRKSKRRAMLATHALSLCGQFLASQRISIPSPAWIEKEEEQSTEYSSSSILSGARSYRASLKDFPSSEGLSSITERVLLLLSSIDLETTHVMDDQQEEVRQDRAVFLPSVFPLLPNFCLRCSELLCTEEEEEEVGEESDLLELAGANREVGVASSSTKARKRPRRRPQNPQPTSSRKQVQLTLTPCNEAQERFLRRIFAEKSTSSLLKGTASSALVYLSQEDMIGAAALSMSVEQLAAERYLSMHFVGTPSPSRRGTESVGGERPSAGDPPIIAATSETDLHRARLVHHMALFLHSDHLRLECEESEHSSLWALLGQPQGESQGRGKERSSAVEVVFLPLFLLAAIHTYALDKRFALIRASMPLLRMEAMEGLLRVVSSPHAVVEDNDGVQKRLDTAVAEAEEQQMNDDAKAELCLSLLSPRVPCYLIHLFARVDAGGLASEDWYRDPMEADQPISDATSVKALWRHLQQRCRRAIRSSGAAGAVETTSTASLLFPVVWAFMMLQREASEEDEARENGGRAGKERAIRQSWSQSLSTHVFNVMGGRTQAEEDADAADAIRRALPREEDGERTPLPHTTEETAAAKPPVCYYPRLMHHFLHYIWWSYRCRVQVTKRRGVLPLRSLLSKGNTSSLLPPSFYGTAGGAGGRVTLSSAIKAFMQHERYYYHDSTTMLPMAFAALPLLRDTTELYWLSDISSHRLARGALLLASSTPFADSTASSSSSSSCLSSMASMWMELSGESFCGPHSGLPTRPLLSVLESEGESMALSGREVYVLFPQQPRSGGSRSTPNAGASMLTNTYRRNQAAQRRHLAVRREREARIQSFHQRTAALSALVTGLLPDEHCGFLVPCSAAHLQRRALQRLVARDALQEMCAKDMGLYALRGRAASVIRYEDSQGVNRFSATALMCRLTNGEALGANARIKGSFSFAAIDDDDDEEESQTRAEWFRRHIMIGVGIEEELNQDDIGQLLAASSAVAQGWGETNATAGREGTTAGSYSSAPSHILAILNRAEEDAETERHCFATGGRNGPSHKRGRDSTPTAPVLPHHLLSLRAKALMNEGLLSEAMDTLLEALSTPSVGVRSAGMTASSSAAVRLRSLLAEAACKCATWTPSPSVWRESETVWGSPVTHDNSDEDHIRRRGGITDEATTLPSRRKSLSITARSTTSQRVREVLSRNGPAGEGVNRNGASLSVSSEELVFASLCAIQEMVENGHQSTRLSGDDGLSMREVIIRQQEQHRVLKQHTHHLYQHVFAQLYAGSQGSGSAENWLPSVVLLQTTSDLETTGSFCAAYATRTRGPLAKLNAAGSISAGPAGIAPQWMEELGGYLPRDRTASRRLTPAVCGKSAVYTALSSSSPPHHRALMVSNASVELLAEVRQSLCGLLCHAAAVRAAHSLHLWRSMGKITDLTDDASTDCHALRAATKPEPPSWFRDKGIVAGIWSMWAAAIQRYGTSAVSSGLPYHAHRWISQFLHCTSALVVVNPTALQAKDPSPNASSFFYLSDALRTSLTLLQARSLYALGWGKEAIDTLQSAPHCLSSSTCAASSAMALLWHRDQEASHSLSGYRVRKYMVPLPLPPYQTPRVVHQLMQWELSRGRIPLHQLVRDRNFSQSACQEAAVSLQLAQLCHRLTKAITSRLHSSDFQRLEEGLAQSRETKEHLMQKLQVLQREMMALDAVERSAGGDAADVVSKKKALHEKLRPIQHRLRALEADIGREEKILLTEIQNYELYRRSAINSYSRYLNFAATIGVDGFSGSRYATCSACRTASQNDASSGVEGGRGSASRLSTSLSSEGSRCAAHRWTMHEEARCQCDGESSSRVSPEGEVIAMYALVELWLRGEDPKVAELNAAFPLWQADRKGASRSSTAASPSSSSPSSFKLLKLVDGIISKIPTHSFLRVYPLMASQLAAGRGSNVPSTVEGRGESFRMDSNGATMSHTVQNTLEKVLERVAAAHPHECVWALLALAHGDRYTMQDPSMRTGSSALLALCKPEGREGSRFNGVVEQLFGDEESANTGYSSGETARSSSAVSRKSIEGQDGVHVVDTEKVRAARRILLRLASPKHHPGSTRSSMTPGTATSRPSATSHSATPHYSPLLRQQVNEMAYLSMAYIELSFYQNYKTTETRNVPIPSTAMFMNLTNVSGSSSLDVSIAPPTHSFSTAEGSTAAQLGDASRRGCAGAPTSLARVQRIIDTLQNSGGAYLPHLSHYAPFFTTPGGITRPKVLRCALSSGQRAKQLLKSNDDLRQDATLERFFELTNTLFMRATGSPAALSLRTYNVVPLAPTVGMIQWVEHTIPLGEYIAGADGQSGAHQRYFPEEISSRHCRQQLQEAPVKPVALRNLYDAFTPALHYFFYENFSSTWEAWLSHQQRYGRSVATSSMVGYIVGLGDRHGSNLLLHQHTGEVVHIDLGYAFDQSKLLPIPERVPFRLTRNIVDGLGIRGVQGDFVATCATALTLLRAARPLLLLVMESVLHDPLARWSISVTNPSNTTAARGRNDNGTTGDDFSPISTEQQAAGAAPPNTSSRRTTTHQTPSSAQMDRTAPLGQQHRRELISSSDAQRALSRVADKLSGYDDNTSMRENGGGEHLPPVAHVHKLIEEAQQVDQLALMYPGWSPWI